MDNEAKLMTKFAPEWVRTSDPVIRSPARYRWGTAPAENTSEGGGNHENQGIYLYYKVVSTEMLKSWIQKPK